MPDFTMQGFWSRNAYAVVEDLFHTAVRQGQDKVADFFGDLLNSWDSESDLDDLNTSLAEEIEDLKAQVEARGEKYDKLKEENEELQEKLDARDDFYETEIKRLQTQLSIAENEVAKAKL